MCVYVNANVSVGTLRDQKRVPDLQELEFQSSVSPLMCVLGTGLGFSSRAASPVHCGAACPVPNYPSCCYDQMIDKTQLTGERVILAHSSKEYSLCAS